MEIKIKNIFIIFILCSCSAINNNNFIGIYENYIKDNGNPIINENIKNSKYAMQYFQIDSVNRLSFLEVVENDKFIWALGSDIKLITQGNKIIQSVGLDNDFSISACKKEFTYIMQSINDSKITNSCLVRFSNPDSSFLDIFYRYEVIKTGKKIKLINNFEYEYRLIREKFNIPLIGFKGENFYWVDPSGVAWESKQIISPHNTKIRTIMVKSYK